MRRPELDPIKTINLLESDDKSSLQDKFNSLQSHYEYLRRMFELYGTRTAQPYTWQINFDSTYFAEVPFWMPIKTLKINSCKLKIIGSNYRGYSGDVTSGGSGATGGPSPTSSGAGGTGATGTVSAWHTHTNPNTGAGGTGATGGPSTNLTGASGTGWTSSDGSHVHTVGSTAPQTLSATPLIYGATALGCVAPYVHSHNAGTLYQPSHTHQYIKVSSPTSAGGTHHHNGPSHQHSLQSHTHTGPSHSHTQGSTGNPSANHTHTGPSHTHSLNSHTHSVGTHDHGFTLSIIESTDPTGVNVYINDGMGYGGSIASGNSPVDIEINIKDHISITSGWKKVKVTSTRLGRADITLILDIQLNQID